METAMKKYFSRNKTSCTISYEKCTMCGRTGLKEMRSSAAQ
jgi:hypothetical protein